MAGRPPATSRPSGRRRPLLVRPDRHDLQIIGYYVGKVAFGIGLLHLPAAALALAVGEWNAFTAIILGAALSFLVNRLAELRLATDADLAFSHGLVTVALAWLIGPLLLAVPLLLSGHYGSYLDALFDSMSGLTTSGLAVVQDLDHLPWSMNFLRHLTHFAGGQGIVVVVLTSFAASSAETSTLYVGEGREERILPNIVRTARFIYGVAFTYAIVGSLALTGAMMSAGLEGGEAVYNAVNIFMAAFDTGGFAPHSTSLAFYHSLAVELVVTVLMLAGTFSFALHLALWRGRVKELTRNIEVRSLALTTLAVTVVTLFGLARAGTYTDPTSLFRKGFFTVLSAHTGTGFGVTAPRLFVTDWGLIAPAAIVVAMALGGMASSTAGGIKAIRVGLLVKSVTRDIRRTIAPPNAVVVASYHSGYRRILRDGQVSAAISIFVLFVLTYLAGSLVAVFYGYPFDQALFESTSAAANVGLSSGITGPAMPTALKVTYIVQMYLGRLEFLAAFALAGYAVAALRGRA